MKAVKPILVNAINARQLEALERAIDQSKDIEFDMKLIRDCKDLRDLILKEMEVTRKLTEYICMGGSYKTFLQAEPVYDKLVAVMQDADNIKFTSPLVEKGREIKTMISYRMECRESLRSGHEKASRSILEAAIKRAEEINLEETEVLLVNARKELERISQEEKLLDQLMKAMASGYANRVNETTWDHSTIDVKSLTSAIEAAERFGFKTEKGKQAIEESKVLAEIRTVLAAEDYESLSKILKKATNLQKADMNPSTKREIDESYQVGWHLISSVLRVIILTKQFNQKKKKTGAISQHSSERFDR